jgi:hypothetical protein
MKDYNQTMTTRRIQRQLFVKGKEFREFTYKERGESKHKQFSLKGSYITDIKCVTKK